MGLVETSIEMTFDLHAQHRSAGLSVNDCMALEVVCRGLMLPANYLNSETCSTDQ